MEPVIRKLQRKTLVPAQIIGYAFTLLVGVTIVLLAFPRNAGNTAPPHPRGSRTPGSVFPLAPYLLEIHRTIAVNARHCRSP